MQINDLIKFSKKYLKSRASPAVQNKCLHCIHYPLSRSEDTSEVVNLLLAFWESRNLTCSHLGPLFLYLCFLTSGAQLWEINGYRRKEKETNLEEGEGAGIEKETLTGGKSQT